MPTMQDQRNGAQGYRGPPSPMVPQRESSSGDSPEVAELTQWIADCISKGRLSALGLGSRSAVDASLSPIASWDPDDFDKLGTPSEIAEAVMAAAYHDASSQRGTTRYVVNAYRDNERTHFQKHSFRLDGGLEFTDKDETNYPATEAGVLAMQMKHSEFLLRTYSTGQAESMRLLSAQVRELHSQNNKLAAQQYKVLDLQQQMLDRQAERDLAVREQDSKEKRKQMMFEKFLVLWPIIAKKFFGGKDKGTESILAEEQLGALMESFDEEQIRQMVPLFSDEQKMGFFTVYQEYKKRKKRLSEPGHSEEEADGAQQDAAPAQEDVAAEPEPDPEPQADAEAQPTEEVAASAQEMADQAAAAQTEEGTAQTFGEEQATVVEEGAGRTIPAEAPEVVEAAEVAAAPEPQPDRTFELMVEVLGDDLNDEKVGRFAEKLDPIRRAAFLAAVEAKQRTIEGGG